MITPTDKQISMSMHYLNQLKDIHEAREAKTTSIHFRRNLLERQKVKIYQNELDRIRGQISHNEMRNLSSHALNKRTETLEKITKQIN